MTTKRDQSTEVESNPGVTATSQEELKATFLAKMQELSNMAKAMGLDLSGELGAPPAGNEVAVTEGRKMRPGEQIGEGPGATWVPWTREDVDPNEKVPVMVQYIDYLVWPIPDEDGFYKLPVTVNGLTAWLKVGEVNMVNPMFAEVYQSAEKMFRENKLFAQRGPENAPWSRVGKNHQNTWFQSVATTFGMDIDGDVWDGKGLAIVDEIKASSEAAE